MDPITAAILAAAPALASDLVSSAVKDAYSGLKEIIRRKWGQDSALEKAVESAEAKPDSKGRAAVLAEEVSAARAEDDADLKQAVQKLLEALREQGAAPGSDVHVQISGGSVQGVVGAKDVHVGSMNFGVPPSSRSPRDEG